MKVSLSWYEGCKTDREKDQMRADLLASLPVLKELGRILEEKKESSRKARTAKDKYDCASWPYLQADGIGEERAYDTILKLISIKVDN